MCERLFKLIKETQAQFSKISLQVGSLNGYEHLTEDELFRISIALREGGVADLSEPVLDLDNPHLK